MSYAEKSAKRLKKLRAKGCYICKKPLKGSCIAVRDEEGKLIGEVHGHHRLSVIFRAGLMISVELPSDS